MQVNYVRKGAKVKCWSFGQFRQLSSGCSPLVIFFAHSNVLGRFPVSHKRTQAFLRIEKFGENVLAWNLLKIVEAFLQHSEEWFWLLLLGALVESLSSRRQVHWYIPIHRPLYLFMFLVIHQQWFLFLLGRIQPNKVFFACNCRKSPNRR